MSARSEFIAGIGTAPTALLTDGTVLPRHALLDAEMSRYIGMYDHVTRLPNRILFIEDFATLRGHGDKMLVLVTLADARHYNEILRALGHAFSEDFVRAGAGQLSRILGHAYNIYHVSVLSFAFVIDNDGTGAAPALAREIASAFTEAISCNDIPIKARVGIGLLPLDGDMRDPAEALRACLAAAQDSRVTEERYAFYNHRTDAAHLRAFRILSDLPEAMVRAGELSLHFQPRIEMETGFCTGAEALIRWRHPTMGLISPGEFIPLAEQTALIGPLTDWVLRSAISQTRAFVDAGRNLRVSVNASAINLSESGFDQRLLELCSASDLSPEHIEIEFTESALAGSFDTVTAQLNSLRQSGITVAIDDFGSGYSNLSYLTRIPADVLKIDQSFVRPLGEARSGDFLVRQIIEMGKGLGFTVCAEGIENEQAYALLRTLGCHEGQGYLMGRPMPPEAFDRWFRATY